MSNETVVRIAHHFVFGVCVCVCVCVLALSDVVVSTSEVRVRLRIDQGEKTTQSRKQIRMREMGRVCTSYGKGRFVLPWRGMCSQTSLLHYCSLEAKGKRLEETTKLERKETNEKQEKTGSTVHTYAPVRWRILAPFCSFLLPFFNCLSLV